MRRLRTVLLTTMGSALLISSNIALAAAPTTFGQYTATLDTNGASVISAPCPTGNEADCTGAISGDGFLQRQVNINGGSYFQTIILEKGTPVSAYTTGPSTGLADLSAVPFADESFVNASNSNCTGPTCGSGIADSSSVFADNTTSGGSDTSKFNTTATILVGGFKDPADNQIDVTQTINDPTTLTNIGFQLQDASTDNSQPVIKINSTVYLNKDPTATPALTDPHQTFYLQQLKATSSGSLPDLSTLGTATTTGTQVAYAANDLIQVLWVGQTVASDTTTTPPTTQSFGVEAFAVNPNGVVAPATSPTASQSYSSQAAVGSSTNNPFLWDTVFGTTQPVF
jgi:hypothetical protein